MARKKVINLIPNTVKKPSGLKQDGTPNTHWKKFEQRLTDFENVPLENWKHEEVLGYLLKRYREHFDINFTLSYYGPPTKCPEIYCVKRMMTTVGTEKGWILKQYIDWVFDTIIIPKRTKITSLAFFFTKNICNQFRSNFKNNNKITRSTTLPQQYASIAQPLNISTYGELAFAKMAVDNSPNDYEQYLNMFAQLKTIGFNDAILGSLEE